MRALRRGPSRPAALGRATGVWGAGGVVLVTCSCALPVVGAAWAGSLAAQVAPEPFHFEPARSAAVTLPAQAPRGFALGAPAPAWSRISVTPVWPAAGIPPAGAGERGAAPGAGAGGPPGAPGPGPGAAQGGRPNPADVLVVLALYSDSPEPWVPAEEVRRVLFDGPADPGTFVDFYREASRGVVEPGGAVTSWVRTDVTLLEGAGDLNGHGWVGERMQDWVKQAVDLVDPAVDFGQYDNDGPDGLPNSGDDDGWIDAFVIEYLEIPGSCGGPGPWPHFGGLREDDETPGWPVDETGPGGEPLRIQAYLTESVTDCSGTGVQGPNIIAHEYGHLLGLPDLYQPVEGIEPEKRHWNIGCFGLMGAGAWGCGTGLDGVDFGPVHHSVLMKAWLDWLPIVPLGPVREEEVVLRPAQDVGGGVEIPLPDGSSFLLEYRPQRGFDADLPAGGVLVYHHDPAVEERDVPQGLPPAKWYHLVEADGDHALRKVEAEGGNRGVAGDVFGTGGRTGPFSSASEPARLMDHEGGPVPVTLHEVTVEGGLARVVVSTHPTPAVMAVDPVPGARILAESELASVRVAGGALPYQVTLDDPDVDGAATVDGTEIGLAGVPRQAGVVEITLTVTDALGFATELPVTLEVEDRSYALDILAEHALTAPAPGSEPSRYLDAQGNRNGMADVGDLRAWLRRTGG